MKIHATSWLMLSFVVVTSIIEVAQAFPLPNTVDQVNVERTIYARGLGDKFKGLFKNKGKKSKGEMSTHLLDEGPSSSHSSSGGNSPQYSYQEDHSYHVGPSHQEDHSSRSSSVQSDGEVAREVAQFRAVQNANYQQHHTSSLDLMDLSAPRNYHTPENLAWFEQQRSYGYVPPVTPARSGRSTRNNSPVASRGTSPATSPVRNRRAGYWDGNLYYASESGSEHGGD